MINVFFLPHRQRKEIKSRWNALVKVESVSIECIRMLLLFTHIINLKQERVKSLKERDSLAVKNAKDGKEELTPAMR